MVDQVHEGGCGCGAVRFRVEGEPIYVNNCHCIQCQRQTGSTSVLNAFYETERVALLSGNLTSHVVKAGSGGPHEIMRCSECGVALWSYYPRFGRLGTGLRVSTLDDAATFRPNAIIFVSEKMPWVALPDGIPAFERTYDPHTILRPEPLQRFTALLQKATEGRA